MDEIKVVDHNNIPVVVGDRCNFPSVTRRGIESGTIIGVARLDPLYLRVMPDDGSHTTYAIQSEYCRVFHPPRLVITK